MNFTREPIIETVITPREGCQLVIRSSKGNGQEEYIVEAVEVVSFGRSFFFRSLERPKSFLVPVSDYEVLELKETRMVLKNVSSDRAIKIGGGRDSPPRPQQAAEEPSSEERPSDRPEQQQRPDRKRDRRRRGRRGRDRHHSPQEMREQESPSTPPQESHSAMPVEGEEPPPAPSFISKLFPPPPTLIKESLSRYKPSEESDLFPKEVDTYEPPIDTPPEEDLEE